MNRATYLAEKIKDDLNDTFSEQFQAIRAYRASYYLKELKTLKVIVMVSDMGLEVASRAGNLDKISIDVLFQKQADPGDLTILDPLLDLAMSVSDYLRCRNYTNDAGTMVYLWLGSEIVAPYDMEDLINWRVFTSVIRISYQISTTEAP